MAASSYFPRVSGLAAASRRAGFSINLTSHARVSHLLATMSPHSARVFYPEALSHAHGAEPVPAPRSFDEYTWSVAASKYGRNFVDTTVSHGNIAGRTVPALNLDGTFRMSR